MRVHTLAAWMTPELLRKPPSKERAQGMPGARRTHSLACESKKARRVSHHRSNAINRHSLRDGFNGLFRALPGDRALLPPSLSRIAPRKLDASVGASGPHDLAVREPSTPKA